VIYCNQFASLTNLNWPTAHRQALPATVKVEPKSPNNPSTKKHKVYSTTDAKPVGRINSIIMDLDPTPNGKCQKTNLGVVQVCFDGVEVPDKPTRTTRNSSRSAKAMPKKDMGEIFGRLAQELQAVADMYDELANMN